MDDRKWNVHQGYWHQRHWEACKGFYEVRLFNTWQEAFDHAFTEATRELSN